MLDENNPYESLDPEEPENREKILRQTSGIFEDLDVKTSMDYTDVVETNSQPEIEKVEQNLLEITNKETFENEKDAIVEHLDRAIVLLTSIDVNKTNIVDEMVELENLINVMKDFENKITNRKLRSRFDGLILFIENVLNSGRASLYAKRGMFGFGGVKNREEFISAINTALQQASIVASIY